MTGPTPGDFDSVLHSGPRITIMSRLCIHKTMRFAELQKSTELSPGNLTSHLEVLEKAGYVKQDVDERKVVRAKTLKVTSTGDTAFRAYLEQVRLAFEHLQASLPS